MYCLILTSATNGETESEKKKGNFLLTMQVVSDRAEIQTQVSQIPRFIHMRKIYLILSNSEPHLAVVYCLFFSVNTAFRGNLKNAHKKSLKILFTFIQCAKFHIRGLFFFSIPKSFFLNQNLSTFCDLFIIPLECIIVLDQFVRAL